MSKQICPICNGSCLEPGHSLSKCPTCFGMKNLISMRGFVKSTVSCFTCAGTGKAVLLPDRCLCCTGTGYIRLVVPDEPTLQEETASIQEASSKTQAFVNRVKQVRLPAMPSMPNVSNPFKKKKVSK